MHSIWAVAVNTLKQALRLKIAAVFIILLLVLLPLMGVVMTGDGTVKGRLQTFISYGLSLANLLLCLLTIIVAIYSVTSDFQHRQIYTVLTKPVRRCQFLLGKLLGVILLDAGLLVLFSTLVYAITVYTPRLAGVGESELARLDDEFFTARASLIPAEPDVTEEVEETYKRLEKNRQLPQNVLEDKRSRRSYIAAITRRKKIESRAVSVGDDLLWEFGDVKPLDPNEHLFVRFKYDVSVNPPDLCIFGRWEVGDYRQVKYGAAIETPIYGSDRKDTIRTFHEIEVPGDAIADDGYLAVRFVNVPLNNTVVIFGPQDGLEVLYKADTFTVNFIRAVILIFFRLIFLASMGVLASTFLSFPVAVLLCLVVFFTATISGFCLESFKVLGENAGFVYSYTLRPLIHLLPRFDKFNPSNFLIPGRLLSWTLLAEAAGFMVCVKAGLLMLLGLLIFSYREIAKIIV
jgi:hypothetical protein